MNIDNVIGFLVSILGVIIVILLFTIKPKKEDNQSLKSANFQFKIIGFALFIISLMTAI